MGEANLGPEFGANKAILESVGPYFLVRLTGKVVML